MPVDAKAPEGATKPETESPMFAPTPLWARDVKKRRAARPVRPAARQAKGDPAIDAGEPGAGAGVLGATTAAEPLDMAYETQPAEGALRTMRRHSNGVAVGTVAASAVIVAALGVIGWYASRWHDGGVAELTPGAPATSTVALNTAAPPANPIPATSPPSPAADSAATMQEGGTTQTRPQPAAGPRRARAAAVRAPAPRVRPADSSSALDAAVNAGATAPMVVNPSPVRGGSPASPVPQTSPIVPPLNATPAQPPATAAAPAGSANSPAAPTIGEPTAALPAMP